MKINCDFSIDTDIEETARFKDKTLENDKYFLSHIFTEKGLKYCFLKGVLSQHLSARFCGKATATSIILI